MTQPLGLGTNLEIINSTCIGWSIRHEALTELSGTLLIAPIYTCFHPMPSPGAASPFFMKLLIPARIKCDWTKYLISLNPPCLFLACSGQYLPGEGRKLPLGTIHKAQHGMSIFTSPKWREQQLRNYLHFQMRKLTFSGLIRQEMKRLRPQLYFWM